MMTSTTRENRFYDVQPRIVPADRQTPVAIRARFIPFRDGQAYEVTHISAEYGECQKQTVTAKADELRVCFCFQAEQEHILKVEQVDGDDRALIGAFRLYSLEPDLFDRRPYKGDFHIHSLRSDGLDPPAYVAGVCRQVGLDFAAVTDHRAYEPSLEAIRAFENVSIDLKLFPGEEVHPPGNPVHIINFGGRFSINKLFGTEADHREQVRETLEKIGTLPDGVDPFQYASTVWCFDRIRQAGGLGMFCHPYWIVDYRYHPGMALTDHIFETQPFDCYEVIGGYEVNCASNSLQIARYEETRARGRMLPIAGVSDAHGCFENPFGDLNRLFSWYYTIVFSPSLELHDLIGSIKGLYSVAVEALPNERPRVVGPYRLVKFALFLLREYYPQHDELCLEEGRHMLAHAAGESSAAEMLTRLQGRTNKLLEQAWKPQTVNR